MTQFNAAFTPCAPQESETKKALTREETLALREAYVRGGTRPGMGPQGWAILRGRAERAYPLPKKITVPREIGFDGLRYRYVNGTIQYKSPVTGVWSRSKALNDIGGLKALLGLIDNPTCEVDA